MNRVLKGASEELLQKVAEISSLRGTVTVLVAAKAKAVKPARLEPKESVRSLSNPVTVANASTGNVIQVRQNSNGLFLWELRSQGRVIAQSGTAYSRKTSCLKALDSAKRSLSPSAVVDTCGGKLVIRQGEWTPGDTRASVPSHIRAQVWVLDAGVCHLCNAEANPNDWHVEHALPRSLGGGDEIDNLRVAHPVCNLKKSNRRIDPRRGVTDNV